MTLTAPPPCPSRPLNAHKGTFGTVIVVGGCKTMIGAPALCASASLRAGAGLVKVAVAEDILKAVLTLEPCATGIVLGRDMDDNDRVLQEVDPSQKAILAMGPGLGQSPWAGQLVARLVPSPRGLVLDADGLNLLAQRAHQESLWGVEPNTRTNKTPVVPTQNMPTEPLQRTSGVVMTPHPGEFKRLADPFGITADPIDPASRPQAAEALAKAYQAVVVLKGRRSLVSDGKSLYENTTGNPALATPGSGDVLTGTIAAFMAGGMSGFDAAALGVYLHGLAADLWARRYGPSGMTASDLVRLLPEAINQHRAAGPSS